jgi:predicted DNA-binding protein
MSTVTLRIPDEKYERLKNYAKQRGISVNKVFDEMATVTLAQFDAKNRFERLAAEGDRKRGLRLLEELDEHFS